MIRVSTIGCLLAAAAFAQDKPILQLRPPQDHSREIPHQQMKRWLQDRRAKNESWLRADAKDTQMAPEKCAHILTYVPPKDLDPGMSLGKFADGGRITTVPAMPTCEQDIRVLPSVNKTPEAPAPQQQEQPAEKK